MIVSLAGRQVPENFTPVASLSPRAGRDRWIARPPRSTSSAIAGHRARPGPDRDAAVAAFDRLGRAVPGAAGRRPRPRRRAWSRPSRRSACCGRGRSRRCTRAAGAYGVARQSRLWPIAPAQLGRADLAQQRVGEEARRTVPPASSAASIAARSTPGAPPDTTPHPCATAARPASAATSAPSAETSREPTTPSIGSSRQLDRPDDVQQRRRRGGQPFEQPGRVVRRRRTRSPRMPVCSSFSSSNASATAASSARDHAGRELRVVERRR